jgi:hypothetical protein
MIGDSFVLPLIVCQCDGYEYLHFMQAVPPKRIAFSVRTWLHNNFRVRLGVDQQIDPHDVPIFFSRMVYFCGLEPNRKSADQNLRALDELEASVEPVSVRLQKCVQKAGDYVEIWYYLVVYGLSNGAEFEHYTIPFRI